MIPRISPTNIDQYQDPLLTERYDMEPPLLFPHWLEGKNLLLRTFEVKKSKNLFIVILFNN